MLGIDDRLLHRGSSIILRQRTFLRVGLNQPPLPRASAGVDVIDQHSSRYVRRKDDDLKSVASGMALSEMWLRVRYSCLSV